MLRIWNLVLIGLTYSLCLFGTMITRSGLVQSVHAFAQTALFGQLFMGYVFASAALFFGLLFWRRDALRSPQRLESRALARGRLPVQQLGVHGDPRHRLLGHAVPEALGLVERHRRSCSAPSSSTAWH